MKTLATGLLFVTLCGLAQAADDPRRAQIQREREAVEARHARQAQDCRQQFVVTPCLDKARTDKQKALQRLRTQETALDEAQRSEKSREQAQRVANKARVAEMRESASSPARAPKPPRVAAPRPVKPPSAPSAAPDRTVVDRQRREEYESRRREIQEHKQAVEKRNAERAAARKPAQPLPVPASAVRP